MSTNEPLRVCRNCYVEKPLSAYSLLTRDPEGHQTTCKTCALDYQRFRRAKFPEKTRRIDMVSALRNITGRQSAQRAYRQSESGRQAAINSTRNRRKKSPAKVNASNAVARAIRKGVLTKQPCEVCGTEVRVEAHHPDYTKPLEVKWLCRTHHREEHLREDYKNVRAEIFQTA